MNKLNITIPFILSILISCNNLEKAEETPLKKDTSEVVTLIEVDTLNTLTDSIKENITSDEDISKVYTHENTVIEVINEDSTIIKTFHGGDVGTTLTINYKNGQLNKIINEYSAPEYYSTYEEFSFMKELLSKGYFYNNDRHTKYGKSIISETSYDYFTDSVIIKMKSDTILHTYDNKKLDSLEYTLISLNQDSILRKHNRLINSFLYSIYDSGSFEYIFENIKGDSIHSDLKLITLNQLKENLLVYGYDNFLDSLFKNKYIKRGDTVVVKWIEKQDYDGYIDRYYLSGHKKLKYY